MLYLIVYDFTRFRYDENCTQEHFKCVMVCFCTYMPQKTRPVQIHKMWSSEPEPELADYILPKYVMNKFLS